MAELGFEFRSLPLSIPPPPPTRERGRYCGQTPGPDFPTLPPDFPILHPPGVRRRGRQVGRVEPASPPSPPQSWSWSQAQRPRLSGFCLGSGQPPAGASGANGSSRSAAEPGRAGEGPTVTRLEGSPVLGRETPYDGAAGGGKGRGETSRGPSKVAPQVGRRCGEVPLPTQGRTSPNWLWEARGRGWGRMAWLGRSLGS